MNYLKNIEICKLYGVSPATPVRWIKQAKLGKNELKLIEVDGKHKVEDNHLNHIILEKMAKEGQKFATTGDIIKVEPKPEFYQIFNEYEIAEICQDLVNTSSIKLKFSYYGKGATIWSQTYNSNFLETKEEVQNFLNRLLIEIVQLGSKNNNLINVVDIGCGNGKPLERLLEVLNQKKILYRYTAIDASKNMLEISKNELINKFNNQIPVQTLNLDFTGEEMSKEIFRFNSIPNVSNSYFHLNNFGNDGCFNFNNLLNFTNQINSQDTFSFDFSMSTKNKKYPKKSVKNTLSEKRHLLMFELLGVDTKLISTEVVYDEASKTRIKYAIIHSDYEIKVNTFGFEKIILLNKGQRVKVWSYQLYSLEDIYSGLTKAKLIPILLKIDDEAGRGFAVCKKMTKEFFD